MADSNVQTGMVTYANCIEEVRQRLQLILAVVEHRFTTGTEPFDIELVFLQFRKSLELIAFASLTANKDVYSAAHANFASHWRAKGLLECIEKVNPEFYPVPLTEPIIKPNGVKHMDLRADGFLTKDEFVELYDYSSEILHSRNPFSAKPNPINIRHSVTEWVNRFGRLLGLHIVQLVDESRWLCQVPEQGNVQMFEAQPTTKFQIKIAGKN